MTVTCYGCPITCLSPQYSPIEHHSKIHPLSSLLPFSNTYCGCCPIARCRANHIQWPIRKVLLLQDGTIYTHIRTIFGTIYYTPLEDKVLWFPQSTGTFPHLLNERVLGVPEYHHDAHVAWFCRKRSKFNGSSGIAFRLLLGSAAILFRSGGYLAWYFCKH